ncbi:MAG: GntR family transcriptional regulator, partial [Chloroflexi bacterium]|nr:GntR family transcriptional regulator [Chloroflexota bacterium]
MAAPKEHSHRSSRADSVYDAIKADIVSLKARPGSMIQEEALAQRLGVSRTPVREALRRLGQEGLVQTLPKKGTIIAGITIGDIREVFQIRLALEPLAARLATENFPREEISRLRAGHVPPTPPRTGIVADYLDLHACIRRHCGNERLRSILELLNLDVSRVLGTANVHHQMRSLEHHLRIIDALESRDGAAAEESMRDHILESQQ